jgi:hypothetical protein
MEVYSPPEIFSLLEAFEAKTEPQYVKGDLT